MNELVAIQKHESMEIFTRRELITPLLLQIEHAATQEKARQQQDNIDAVHGSIIDDWMAAGFDPLQSSLILAAVLDGKIRGLRVVY